jgi:MraZ protein
LLENKLLKLNQFDPKESKFLSMFLQTANEDTLDPQSRLLIPQNLIEYAGIEKEVFILGKMSKIEVWNPVFYQESLDKEPVPYETLAKEVMTKDEMKNQ